MHDSKLIEKLFWFVFCGFYVFSGFITWSGVAPFYRVGLLPIVLLPLLFSKYVVRSPSYIYLSLFAVTISLSFLYNLNNVNSIIVSLSYLRIPLFIFLLSVVIGRYIAAANVDYIWFCCRVLVFVQLPIVVLQYLFSDTFSAMSSVHISAFDSVFGSFQFSSDFSMAYFVFCCLAIVLYFEWDKVFGSGERVVFCLVSILIILLAGSEMIMLCMVVLFCFYGIKYAAFSRFGIFTFMTFILLLMVIAPNFDYIFDFLYLKNSYLFDQIADVFSLNGISRADYYVVDKIRRGDAVDMLLSSSFEVIGTGPYSVFNPLNRSTLIPTEDTLITMYFELGAIGVTCFLLFFLRRAFEVGVRSSVFIFIGLFCIMLISNLLTQLSVLFTYLMFMRIIYLFNHRPALAPLDIRK